MSDLYEEPLDELRDALVNGEAVEAAIVEIARDHGVPAEGLQRRAERAFGDLAAYGRKRAAEHGWLADQEQSARDRMKIAELTRLHGKNSSQVKDEKFRMFMNRMPSAMVELKMRKKISDADEGNDQ